MPVLDILPGAVAANTAIPLPANLPNLMALAQVVVSQDAVDVVASTTSPITAQVVGTMTSAGLTGTQIYLDASTQALYYGSATNTGMKFLVEGWSYGELPRVV